MPVLHMQVFLDELYVIQLSRRARVTLLPTVAATKLGATSFTGVEHVHARGRPRQREDDVLHERDPDEAPHDPGDPGQELDQPQTVRGTKFAL